MAEYTNETIRDLYRYNLCSFYLLPFCEVNFRSFGENNFVNCWVHPKGDYLAVLVKDKALCEPEVYACKHYLGTAQENPLIHAYRLPAWWLPEFFRFKEGKFSQFSRKAKELLKMTSGLAYQTQLVDEKDPFTDIRIGALDRDPIVRRRLMDELGCRLDAEDELMQVPKDDEYKEF